MFKKKTWTDSDWSVNESFKRIHDRCSSIALVIKLFFLSDLFNGSVHKLGLNDPFKNQTDSIRSLKESFKKKVAMLCQWVSCSFELHLFNISVYKLSLNDLFPPKFYGFQLICEWEFMRSSNITSVIKLYFRSAQWIS